MRRSPEFYSTFIKSARENLKAKKSNGAEEFECLKAERAELERALPRWIDVFEQEKAGYKTALGRIDDLNIEIEKIDERLKEVAPT